MARRRVDPDVLPVGSEVILEQPTGHGLVRIEQDPSNAAGRLMFLDGIACSYIDLDDPTHLEFSYVRRFADLADAWLPEPAPARFVHVGGGAASLARYLADTRPRATQTVYEYDGQLVELAREHLGLQTSPGFRIRIGDARPRLDRRSEDSADIVFGDAFVGRRVPGPLSSVEYLRTLHRILAPGGLYLLNIIAGPDLHLARKHAAGLRTVFRTVLISADPDVLDGRASGNLVCLATDVPERALPIGRILRACTTGAYPDRVLRPAEVAEFAAAAPPFRDGD